MFQPVVDKSLNIEQNFTEILFQSKVIEELCHVLGVVESLQWIGFNEGDLKNLNLKLWDNVSFKYFLSLEIQLFYQKQHFAMKS
jgi:hypothetical protein